MRLAHLLGVAVMDVNPKVGRHIVGLQQHQPIFGTTLRPAPTVAVAVGQSGQCSAVPTSAADLRPTGRQCR